MRGCNRFDMFDKGLNGVLHIQLTANNVIICCSDGRGNVVL